MHIFGVKQALEKLSNLRLPCWFHKIPFIAIENIFVILTTCVKRQHVEPKDRKYKCILACCHLPHRKAQMSLQQEFYFPFIELFEKTLKNVEKLRIPWFICCCCTPLHGQTSPLFQLSKLIVKNWSFIISLPPIFLPFSKYYSAIKPHVFESKQR